MSTYKGFTPSRQKANDKYLSEKVDSIMVRVPKGKKAEIQAAAEGAGLSLNQFCARAILEKLPDNT
jgi:predicted HicB family RNase H-like nuclease